MPNPRITRLDTHWIEAHVNLDTPGALVLFDIDSTIMNTAPRNFAILEEASREFEFLEGITGQMTLEDVGWNVCKDVQSVRRLTEKQSAMLYHFWEERFFVSPWIGYDTPYPGVRELLDWLHQRCRIVYLTGRDSEYMREATIASFVEHQLPSNGNTTFLFKPSRDIPDLEFKQAAFEHIKTLGEVVLAIENEPANANAMLQAFPNAAVGLIQTLTAPNPASPHKDIFLFETYEFPENQEMRPGCQVPGLSG